MHTRARLRPTKVLVVLAVALIGLALGGGKAMADSSHVGAVYTQTNTIPNSVRVFYRTAGGQLTPGPTVPTGGAGTLGLDVGGVGNPPFGLDVTDSNYSVLLTQDNRFLLVTNNGTNDISSFRVLPDGNIAQVGLPVSSQGTFPNSLAATNTGVGRTIVYVLNEASTAGPTGGGHATLDGFTLDSQGQLQYIPGSNRVVTGGTFSASIEFDPSGHVLTVTNRDDPFLDPSGTISTFTMDPATGLLGPETTTQAQGSGAPFGLDYTNRDQLIVANAGELSGGLVGTGSSYDVSKKTGAVTPEDPEVPTGVVTCWVRVSKNNQYAYFTSPGTQAIVSYKITASGALIPNGSTTVTLEPVAGDSLGISEGSPLDLDFSVDGQYLYVLVTDVDLGFFKFSNSRVDQYHVNADGSLTFIGTTPAGSGGTSGLAAY